MTELEVLQLLVANNDELIEAVNTLTKVITYSFITILIFYFRWEFKGGTFRR